MEANEEGRMEAQVSDSSDLCIGLLSKAYPKATVTNEMPPDHPKRPYVMVSQTGGDETGFLSRPIVTLQCWDASDDGARRLAQGCAQTLSFAAQEHPMLSAASLVALARDEYSPGPYGSYAAQVRLTINK